MRSLGIPIRDLEVAKQAYLRIENEVDAVDENDLSAQNLDLINGASIVLGVAPGILAYHARAAKNSDFEIRNMDMFVDYANALWYLCITNLPEPEAPRELEEQVPALRAKLLLWAQPLATTGIFNQVAIDKIKEGAGIKDAAGDIVALSSLYRLSWDNVKNMCGVTEADLDLADKIGPAVFASASRRENGAAMAPPEAAMRIRKTWTLLDRSYTQCRRLITYYRYLEGDWDAIAPSLRRNVGRRSTPDTQTAEPQPVSPVAAPVSPATPTGPVLGGGGSPFIANR